MLTSRKEESSPRREPQGADGRDMGATVSDDSRERERMKKLATTATESVRINNKHKNLQEYEVVKTKIFYRINHDYYSYRSRDYH